MNSTDSSVVDSIVSVQQHEDVRMNRRSRLQHDTDDNIHQAGENDTYEITSDWMIHHIPLPSSDVFRLLSTRQNLVVSSLGESSGF